MHTIRPQASLRRVNAMGRKEYENKEHSTGPNSAKYHSRSANFKKSNKAQEQNTKEKFINTGV